MKQWKEWLGASLFPAETDRWITYLRVGLGLQVVLYTLSLRADWSFLFGGTDVGLNGRAFSEALLSTETPFVPRLGWLVTLGSHIGFSEWTVLSLVWWAFLCAGCSLLVGLFSRAAAILAWLLHLCAAKSGGLVAYGVDNFMTIGLFYLMLSPLPDRYSLDQLWRKPQPKDRQWSRRAPGDIDGQAERPSEREQTSQLLGFFRRILQIHLCLIYFFSGLAKSLGSGWWDGSNLWRALIRPPFNVIDPAMLVRWKYLFPAAGIVICVLETAYPFLIWNRRTRGAWLICICVMHIAIGLTMGMYLFALVMIVLNLAAFGPDFERRQDKQGSVRMISGQS
jgi:hypothetical protein